MPSLLAVCEKCHTSANHQKGGKLYGLKPKLKPFKGATSMTAVRFEMFRMAKEIAKKYGVEVHMCYGAGTKCTRKELNIEKSHANDAYCIGERHPKHRSPAHVFQKIRRNDRKKEKFYDAEYIDLRTGEKAKGKDLGCGRTKRNTHLEYEDLRPFRGKKAKKGHRTISWGNPPYKTGSVARIRKTIRKKDGPDEVIEAVRKIKTARGTLRSKKLMAKVQAGKHHCVKPEDIYWSIGFENALPDGTKSTSAENIVEVLSQPIQKGWEKLS